MLQAHHAGDLKLLAGFYVIASTKAECNGNRDRAAFFLTQAWILCLEAGDCRTEDISRLLTHWGSNG